MAKFKSKAESSFESKLEFALLDRDWNEVQHLFYLMGCYFELVEPIVHPEPVTKELEFVGHNEPSAVEEVQYVISGEHAKFCRETLGCDPLTLERITCNFCGEPIKGFSSIQGVGGVEFFYCHEGDDPTCYQKAQWSMGDGDIPF